MIALAYLFVTGVVNFAEQPLPGLEAGSRVFPAALAAVNTRSADIDEDGVADLVLPSGVWLQKGGLYPKTNVIPLPDRSQFEAIHAEKGRLYGYGADRLACYSLFAGKWREEWTVGIPTFRTPDVNLQPLFDDFDGDGHAELIVPHDDLLLVHRVSDGAQVLAALPVFPPVRPQLDSVNNLWASLSQPSAGAVATRDFRVAFDGPALTTREALRVGDHRVEYRFVTYTSQRNPDGVFSSSASDKWASTPMPDVMTPYRSIRDHSIAFAGARTFRSGPARLGETLTEVLLASRNDASLRTIRTKAPPAHLALADFDGDGDEDLLTQSNTLSSGPPREVLMRLASARSLRHSFFVHVQDTDGHFDARPRQTLAVDIDLGTPAFEDGPRWHSYRQGALTCASADFNGDGRADVAVWIAAGRLNVWLNHEGVFQKAPDTVLSISEGAGLVPADVDRDGRADLVLLPAPDSDAPPAVWFSR